MAQPSLPVSRVVRVGVSISAAGAQAQSLSNVLVLGTSQVIDTTEKYRLYSSLEEVVADFGSSAEEYFSARSWFSQAPQPTELIIGRWVNAASKGGIKGATLSASQQAIAGWNAITTGSFKIAKDGAPGTDITGLNFSGAANLNAVAAIIQAALTGMTCVWNANYARFEIQSNTTGAASSVGFLVAAATGVNISAMLGMTAASSGAYLYTGQAAVTALEAVTDMDAELGQRWYGVFVPSAVDADHLAIAAYIEGTNTKHIYAVNTQSAGVISAVSTTDIAYLLSQLGYLRTVLQYSSSSAYAVMSLLGRILTVNYNGSNTTITLKFKNEPGILGEALNTTQANAAEAKNANIFVNYNNDTTIIEQGVMVDGTFVDIVTGTDWLAIECQRAVYNLLYTSTTKIPQTDQGMQVLTTGVAQICAQGVTNGLLAPGQWNNGGFGQLNQGDYLPAGYYIWNAPVATQLQADRAARLAMPIQVAAKLAGAIHSADVAITVNQ